MVVKYEPSIWQNPGYQTWRTRSLFVGHYGLRGAKRTCKPIYTLAVTDQWMEWEGEQVAVPSFRRLYLEIGDPTEYRQANELLGGWSHFKALLNHSWFAEVVQECREELEIALRSDALVRIIAEASNEESRSSLAACRYLADGKYKINVSKRGRPSNADVTAETKRQADIKTRISEDMKRIGLTDVTVKH